MFQIAAGLQGVEFWAVNTDAQALGKSSAVPNKLIIGDELTRGLGASIHAPAGVIDIEEFKISSNCIATHLRHTTILSRISPAFSTFNAFQIFECYF